MRKLRVYIEIKGTEEYVGTITGNSASDAFFQYNENALDKKLRISLSLPLQAEPFSPERTRNFFEGLLPEGFTRRSVSQWMHVDENDYLSILAGLGKECLGAVMITDDEDPTPSLADYRPLSAEEVRSLAAEGASSAASIVVRSHLSLAGASGKAGLYYNDTQKKWYQPIGTAPSTHIVKQSHVRLLHVVINEQLSLLTAKNIGLPVPGSFILSTVDRKEAGDSDILLATKRYDRTLKDSVKCIRGCPCPLRLHQEDLAQAMGIPAAMKYENKLPAATAQPGREGSYLARIFNLIRAYSDRPIQDMVTLLDLQIFNVLLGNTDNHIKNISLFYSSDLTRVHLAPVYDLLCTQIYPGSAEEMSIAIAGVTDLHRITLQTFLDAADEIGMQKSMIRREYDRIHAQFVPALQKAEEELAASGMPMTEEIAERIMQLSRLS